MKMKTCLIFALAAASLVAIAGDRIAAFVNKIEDGDTVLLTVTNSVKTIRYRLFGIDAPEKDQSFSRTSKARLTELLRKQSVQIEEHGHDRYRRGLCTIYLHDGTDVNLEMIREGMAWHYTYFFTNETYAAAQKEAKESRRGLWIEKNPVEPHVFRKGGVSDRR